MTSQRARTLTRPASQDEQDVAENWRAKAACRTEDPELFFDEHTAAARKICNTGCPVREVCLKDSLDARDFYGVRGGRTGKQRMFLARNERPPEPRGTQSNLARSAKGERTRAAILALASSGLVASEVAEQLGLSKGTVWSYMAALREQGALPPATRRAGPKAKPINHGTRGGYYTHKARHEAMCEPCKEAMREYNTAHRPAVKAAQR